MLGDFFFFVYMQDSAGMRGLLLSVFNRFHCHIGTPSLLPFSLLSVLGFGVLGLSEYFQSPSTHSFWITSTQVFPHVHVHLAFCLQFRQKPQQGLQLTKGKYLYLLGHFIHRPQLRCILSKIIFKLKQHSKYLI